MEDKEKDKAKGSRTISKKKYYELEKIYNEMFPEEQAKQVMDALKLALNFDPEISMYNEQMKKTIMERRHRLREQGISTYVSSGQKAFYERKKTLKSLL